MNTQLQNKLAEINLYVTRELHQTDFEWYTAAAQFCTKMSMLLMGYANLSIETNQHYFLNDSKEWHELGQLMNQFSKSSF